MGIESYGARMDDEKSIISSSVDEYIVDWSAGVGRLPFEDSRFDLVTAFEALDVAENVDSAMAEVARVLSYHGNVVISYGLGRLSEGVAQTNHASSEVWKARLVKASLSPDEVLTKAWTDGMLSRTSWIFRLFYQQKTGKIVGVRS